MLHQVTFRARARPLVVCGVTAQGEVVARLIERLRARTDAELARLDGLRARDLLLLLGAPEALPWCDGVDYIGRDPQAPPLFLPVHLEPDVPPAWLLPALPGAGRRLVLPGPSGLRVVPLESAGPVDRAKLVPM